MKKCRKIMLIVIFFILNILIWNNYCNASSSGFEKFNNTPRIKIDIDNNKDNAVKITFTDYNGLNPSNIKFYSVNDNNEKVKLKDDNFLVSKEASQVSNNKDVKYTYTISNEYLNKTTNRFYVTVSDATGKTLRTYFKIERENEQYKANYAMRISNWKFKNEKVYFTASDSDGINKITLYDMNNNEKEVKKWEDLSDKSLTVNLDIDKLKKVNGIYQVKVVTEDKSAEKQENIVETSFEIKSDKSDESDKIEKNQKVKILFVGNSKTHVNNIHTKVKELAKSAGYKKVSVKKVTQGGKSLSYLAKNYKEKIGQESYDYVILQEQSNTYTNYSEFLNGAKQVSQIVRQKNSNVKIYVRQLWLYQSSGVAARKKVYSNAEKVAENINAQLIYDGKSFDECKSKYPSINLFRDNIHQSEAGAYLAACAIYEAVFQESSVGIEYKAQLSAENARKLQEIAHSVYQAESE